MLEIDVKLGENYDEQTNKFSVARSVKVRLEHSLVSLSKWEAVWEEAFLGKSKKTTEQTVSYIEMMLLDDIAPEVFHELVKNHIEQIQTYLTAPMTATKLPTETKKGPSRETVTAELIYYWMARLNVPIEFENWHLNRLFTLIRVFNIKDTPPKKMSAQDRLNLNNARRAQLNTRG